MFAGAHNGLHCGHRVADTRATLAKVCFTGLSSASVVKADTADDGPVKISSAIGRSAQFAPILS
jgi:hypothetical protein